MAFASELDVWLNDGMKKTPEEMVKPMDITCGGNLIIALQRAGQAGM